jgi:hypothetical protein
VPLFLCNYHVRKAWLKNLRKKVHNDDTRLAMYKDLCSLQELQAFAADGAVDFEALQHKVESAAEAFVAKYAAEADFCKYFKETCGARLGASVRFVHLSP